METEDFITDVLASSGLVMYWCAFRFLYIDRFGSDILVCDLLSLSSGWRVAIVAFELTKRLLVPPLVPPYFSMLIVCSWISL